jgi:hypothetical protein
MAAKKKWSERSRRSRMLIVVTGVVEVVLLAATLIDVKRRPAEQIKGSKRMWTALAFVNIAGPIAYFSFGRRKRRGRLAQKA